MRRVKLHIDRVMLSGVSIDDPRAFSAELQAELARAIGALPALSASAGGDRRARAARLRIAAGFSSAQVGKNLARVIAGALTP